MHEVIDATRNGFFNLPTGDRYYLNVEWAAARASSQSGGCGRSQSNSTRVHTTYSYDLPRRTLEASCALSIASTRECMYLYHTQWTRDSEKSAQMQWRVRALCQALGV